MTAERQETGRPLGPVEWALVLCAIALGLYLYLGRLDRVPMQRGSEAMYAFPPIQMVESGDYLVTRFQGEIFLDKPSLTFWVIAASYRLLGVSLFAARLPVAVAGLLTIALLGLWVRRRTGKRAGILAALILTFSFEFVFLGMTSAADVFLGLAVLLAALAVDEACRREDGSDIALGTLCGLALALAFLFKGLVGIVLPLGAVAAALFLDRQRPVRPLRRGLWTLLCLAAALAPWHWVMTQRLGAEFWNVFYWQNQFLRGTSHLYTRGGGVPFYYLGVVAWAVFPWSLLLPGALRRSRPSSLPLGMLLFGLVFFSLLVMKREIYLIPLLPACAAVVAEGLADDGRFPQTWQRIAWSLAVFAAGAAAVLWARAVGPLSGFVGPAAAIFLGAASVGAMAAFSGAALAPRSTRALLGAVLACGVLCLSVRVLDERLARFDPVPDWGERVRQECVQGCDGFLLGPNTDSLDFYSRMDWSALKDPSRELPGRMRHRKGFLVVWTRFEPQLAALSVKWEVVDRRAAFGSYQLDLLTRPIGDALQSLSLVRLER